MSNIYFHSKKLKCMVFCISLLPFCDALCAPNNRRSSYSRSSSSNVAQDGKNNEEFENFPFTKSSSTIAKDMVAGIRIKGNNIILLGYEKTFSVTPLKADEDFSDLNFFRQYPKLFSVELNEIKLTNQALENLQKFFPNSLKSLIFDSCILEKDGAELIADIIKKHNSIKAITTKFVKFSHVDAAKVTEAIETLSNLDHLSVAFGEINSDSCAHLESVIDGSKSMRTLAIAWDKVIDKEDAYKKLADAISNLNKLTSLEISILSISEKYTELIISKIADLTELLSFKLYFGNLSLQNHIKLFETAEVLGETIKHFTKLKSLNLSSMLLPKDAMQVVAQSMENLKQLEYLNVSGNVVDKESAALFSNSFKELNFLKTLIIRDCQIDSQSFSELCKSLSALPIVTLSAGNNKIKDGIKSLPIKSMSNLQFVDFANNEVTFDMLMGLLPSTIDHETLQVLDFKNNDELLAKDEKEESTSKRDRVEDWKLRNKSKIGIFGL